MFHLRSLCLEIGTFASSSFYEISCVCLIIGAFALSSLREISHVCFSPKCLLSHATEVFLVLVFASYQTKKLTATSPGTLPNKKISFITSIEGEPPPPPHELIFFRDFCSTGRLLIKVRFVDNDFKNY
jgi:hypothetical protein